MTYDAGRLAPHIWRFLGRVWDLVKIWNSATTFSLVKEAIILPLVLFVLTAAITIGRGWYKPSILQSRGRDLVKALIIAVGGSLALLVAVFLAALPVSFYQDHVDLLGKIESLRQSNSELAQDRDKWKKKVEASQTSPSTVGRSVIPKSAPAPQAPEMISSLMAELRLTCALRNPGAMPSDIVLASNSALLDSYLDGPPGKAFLRQLVPVNYQRSEQDGNAFSIQHYDLGPTSDLIGEPISRLGEYTTIRLSAWGARGVTFRACTYSEVTIRVNGKDRYRHSEVLRSGDMQTNQNPVITNSLATLDLK